MPYAVIARSSRPVRLFRTGRNTPTGLVVGVSGRLQVVVNQRVGAGVQRQVPRLAALAGHLQVRHALAGTPGVADPELSQLLAPQRV